MALPKVYRFREHIAKGWEIDLRVELCPPESSVAQTLPRERFRGVLLGIRRDEQATRAKERVFSDHCLDVPTTCPTPPAFARRSARSLCNALYHPEPGEGRARSAQDCAALGSHAQPERDHVHLA
ncbi:MAG: hypothetical protein ACYCX6_08785 [Vulcanimicrobiaceae bacterium]